jgi:hypothetical protein
MQNARSRIVVAAAMVVGSLFGNLSFIGDSLAAGPSQGPTQAEKVTLDTKPGVPTKFQFGASDGYLDAIAVLTLGARCRVSITRTPAPPGQIESRCAKTSLDGAVPVLEISNPNDPRPSPPQAFIYQVELVGACPDVALPATMEIVTFSNNAGKFDTRQIHYVPPTKDTPQDCEDVTSGLSVPGDPNDTDPRVEGTQDRFSDFFLVNIPRSARPAGPKLNGRFDDLRMRAAETLPELAPRVANAQQAFNMGLAFLAINDTANARAEFQLAIFLLDTFVSRVITVRDNKMITAGQAASLIAPARRLQFLIRQFAGLNDIEL